MRLVKHIYKGTKRAIKNCVGQRFVLSSYLMDMVMNVMTEYIRRVASWSLMLVYHVFIFKTTSERLET